MPVDIEALRQQMLEDEERLKREKTQKLGLKPRVTVLRVEKIDGKTVAHCKCGYCGGEFKATKYKVDKKVITDCGCVKANTPVFNRNEDGEIERAFTQRYRLPKGSVIEYMTVIDYVRPDGNGPLSRVEYKCQCICGTTRTLSRADLRLRRNATCGDVKCEKLYLSYLTVKQAQKAIKNYDEWTVRHMRRMFKLIANGKSLLQTAKAMGEDPMKSRRKPRVG